MTDRSPEEARKKLQEQIPEDPLSPIFHHILWSENQQKFLNSDTYNRLVRGGGRSGKTLVCLADLAMCLRGIHPTKRWAGPFMALCLAISRKQAAMVIGQKLLKGCEIIQKDPLYPNMADKPLIPAWEIKKVTYAAGGIECPLKVVLHNGCILWFAWSDSPSAAKLIQGGKFAYIYIDENAGTRDLVIESRKRLQDWQKPGQWHGCLVWGGHGTEDNEAFTTFTKLCEDREPNHELFQLIPGETGAIDPEATARFAATLTDEEYAIHIDATGERADLVRIFKKQFNIALHTTKAPYEADDSDNLWASYDPGVSHPMGLIIGSVRRNNPRLHIIKCWNRKGGTIWDDIADLVHYLKGRRLAGFVYDTNLKNRDRGGGPPLLEQTKTELRNQDVEVVGWWQSKKNHEPGINLMREWFMQDRYMIHTDTESGGQMLVTQLMKYKGKESTKFTGEGGIVKKDDDLVDPTRYLSNCLHSIGFAWREDWTAGYSKDLKQSEAAFLAKLDPVTRAQADRQAAAKSFRLRRNGVRVHRFGLTRDPVSQEPLPLWMRRR